ncbi:unnamed protein product [Amoebophrya sp. A120]|nr:unnamed protein product [Amoebophrya sp. A120]|eukprot:GSA120T00003305001.1
MRFGLPLLAVGASALAVENFDNEEYFADPSEALNAFHSQYRSMKEEAEHRTKHMKPDEALEILKAKLPEHDHSHLSMLALKARDNGTLNVQEMAKGVVAINNMYKETDQERITTLTTCSQKLYAIYRTNFMIAKEIKGLNAKSEDKNQVYDDAQGQKKEFLDDKKTLEQEREQLKVDHANDMKEPLAKEAEKVTQERIFTVILKGINEKCGSGDLKPKTKNAMRFRRNPQVAPESNATNATAGSAPSLVQNSEEFTVDEAREMDTADAESRMCVGMQQESSMNRLFLSVFSSPEVQEATKTGLDMDSQKAMDMTLANLRAAEDEEVAPKYQSQALLQKSPSLQGPWSVSDGTDTKSPMCGSVEQIDCDVLMTMMGEQLECAREELRKAKGERAALEDKQREEMRLKDGSIVAAQKAADTQQKLMNDARSTVDGYKSQISDLKEERIRYAKSMHLEKTKCHLQLFELEANGLCACKALRNFWLKETLSKAGVEDDAVTDCEAADTMMPTGECRMGPKATGEIRKCVAGNKMPEDDERLPNRKWTRQMEGEPGQSKDLESLGEKLYLECPPETMILPCNRFLCPVDCEVGEWGDWRDCSAECDGGTELRERSVVKEQAFFGQQCPDLIQTQKCNTQKCTENCKLHADYDDEGEGCLMACVQPLSNTESSGAVAYETNYEMVTKRVREPARGGGDCPHHHSKARYAKSSVLAAEDTIDKNICPQNKCVGDEVCADMMDLIIVHECSQATGRLGCWFMAQFVVTLLQKIPTALYGFPTTNVGLVMFGNGKAVKKGDKWVVNPAVEQSPLTDQATDLFSALYNHAKNLMTKESTYNYHLGFSNMAQGLIVAEKLLGDARTTDGGSAITAEKKIVVVTRGRRVECGSAKQRAKMLHNKGIVVDVIMFGPNYSKENFEYLNAVATFPTEGHLFYKGGLELLSQVDTMREIATSLIPKVCPDAISPSAHLKTMCDGAYSDEGGARKGPPLIVVHRGRNCPNWKKNIMGESTEPVDLVTCATEAQKQEFKSFTFKRVPDGSTEANCFTHEEQGKESQVLGYGDEKEAYKPEEKTCNGDDLVKPGSKNPGASQGWGPQPLAPETTHYEILDDAKDCPKPYYKYHRMLTLPIDFTDEYFDGLVEGAKVSGMMGTEGEESF